MLYFCFAYGISLSISLCTMLYFCFAYGISLSISLCTMLYFCFAYGISLASDIGVLWSNFYARVTFGISIVWHHVLSGDMSWRNFLQFYSLLYCTTILFFEIQRKKSFEKNVLQIFLHIHCSVHIKSLLRFKKLKYYMKFCYEDSAIKI